MPDREGGLSWIKKPDLTPVDPLLVPDTGRARLARTITTAAFGGFGATILYINFLKILPSFLE